MSKRPKKYKLPKYTGKWHSTWLQGYIDISYAELVEAFGPPHHTGDEYKTDAEWELQTPDGLATLYNYKDGKNYNGEEGLAVEDIRDWHIGGADYAVVDHIFEALGR